MNPEYSRSIDLLVSCSLTDIPGFEREALFTDTEVTVVGKEYKAAARLHNLKTFLGARHIAVVGRGLIEDPVDTWLRGEGLTRQIVLQVPSYLQALQAVARADEKLTKSTYRNTQ
jgi:DNA-binding transcriptional LysR family regulator